jgi:hypothetical protein
MAVEISERGRASDGSDHLRNLVGEWDAFAGRGVGDDERAGMRSLAQRVDAHRATLFEKNARLQADAPRDDDPAMIARTDANQDAIKACTTMLNEINAALGVTSIAEPSA